MGAVSICALLKRSLYYDSSHSRDFSCFNLEASPSSSSLPPSLSCLSPGRPPWVTCRSPGRPPWEPNTQPVAHAPSWFWGFSPFDPRLWFSPEIGLGRSDRHGNRHQARCSSACRSSRSISGTQNPKKSQMRNNPPPPKSERKPPRSLFLAAYLANYRHHHIDRLTTVTWVGGTGATRHSGGGACFPRAVTGGRFVRFVCYRRQIGARGGQSEEEREKYVSLGGACNPRATPLGWFRRRPDGMTSTTLSPFFVFFFY